MKAGIIGEGKMGTNLFYYLLDFSFSLTWVLSKNAEKDKITRSFNKKARRMLEAGIIDEPAFSTLLSNTRITEDIELLNDCDLIIEAVTEDIDLKRELFGMLSGIVPAGCILATNSSSITPSDISVSLSGKDRIVGLHFFYPVALKNIVEFIITDYTSEEVRQKTECFLSEIKRDHLVLKENSAFILNKIYLDFQNEAFLILKEEGLTISQVDGLIKKHLFPAGVFEFCDSVGIDIMLASVRNYTRGYPDKDHYMKFTSALARLVNEKRTGIKSGAGFYSYPDKEDTDGLPLDEKGKEMTERIIKRLQNITNTSIDRFSSVSGISQVILKTAMQEYLGTEKDL